MRLNGKKNMTPPSAPYSKRVSRLAPLKVCERNNVSGTIGAELRASTSRKASRATTPSAKAPSTRGVPKPREPASISPYTSAPNPSVTSSVPHQSSPPEASGSRLSGTRQNRTTSTTAASGTLRKKTQRQEAYCTNTPPSTGPTTVVSEENPDQVPMARPRCSALKDALSSKVIAQGSSHQNERGQEKRIGFHNPLDIASRGVEVSLDDWQGDIDDGAINKSHARSEDGGDEHPYPNTWGTGSRLRGRANNSLITGRFHEGGHVCALSCSRNGSMSFLVVPERMPMCFTLYIVSSLWKVPEKSIALLLLITKTEEVPLSHSHLLSAKLHTISSCVSFLRSVVCKDRAQGVVDLGDGCACRKGPLN